MLKQPRKRRIERPITRPQSRERQDTLSPKLLHYPALREYHTQHVTESRQRDENRQRALSPRAENIAEQRCGDEALRRDDFFCGNSGEVGDVDEHIEDCNGAKGERGGAFECADGILGFAQGIVGVAVANVAPNNIIEGCDDAVCATGGADEGVVEIVWFIDFEGASKGGLYLVRIVALERDSGLNLPSRKRQSEG